MRYDRNYGGIPRRYGSDYRYGAEYEAREYQGRRPYSAYDRDHPFMRGGYDRPYGREEMDLRYHTGRRFPRGGWAGAYGPGTGLGERQHWYTPWTDPVPGMGMSIPYGMRFGRWL
jgi:hypothetical protein